MQETTHREYLTWQAWLEEEWNNPSRSDHYLMQIAQEVRRVLSKQPGSIKLEHFKLPFTWKKGAIKPLDREQATKQAKARWFGFLGIKETS